MEFKKYNSIENHYDNKNLIRWTTKYPELYEEKFIIQEKIHGSNFSIWFEKENDVVNVRYGKRTAFLEDTESFFNWQQVVLKGDIVLLVNRIKEKMINENIPRITIFGELYGNGIQKGVYYSEVKQINFFDMKICDLYVAPKKFIDFFNEIHMEYMLVPNIKIVNSLSEAKEFNTEFNSLISDKEFKELENISEGIVIKPYEKVYIWEGSIFYIKKKNEKFFEKSRHPRQPKAPLVLSDKVKNLKDTFETYINQNRLDNVFSKFGPIQEMKDIGKYISLLVEDAKQDFFKEYKDEFVILDDREKKEILKVQPLASKIIRENM